VNRNSITSHLSAQNRIRKQDFCGYYVDITYEVGNEEEDVFAFHVDSVAAAALLGRKRCTDCMPGRKFAIKVTSKAQRKPG
jgi:hypothetical protein